MTLPEIGCCGQDMRAILVIDAQPRLAVLICDSCRRRRWLNDGEEISVAEALHAAAAADRTWVAESVDANRP
ncbi:MAG: hypothetical protein QOG53_1699 [Frankiales bacterium]|jgi:hypothetical protein|nr:hypothetical protein [Frankiales bacterium]